MITDFHTHILPNIDDGSKSLQQSLEMLQMLSGQGIERVVATPHFYPQYDNPESFLERRNASEELLRDELAKHSGMPALHVGAEIYYFQGISDSVFLHQMTISGTNSVLIEMPAVKWSDFMFRDLSGIYVKQGLIPIVAHIDRYLGFVSVKDIYDKLSDTPAYIQANAESFLRFPLKNKMLRLLRDGFIQLMGSDCHDMSKRPPNLKSALDVIQKRFGEEMLSSLQSYENSLFQIM